MRLFVGNLAFASSEDSVRQAFTPYGDVSSVHLVTDRDTGQSRGFAFVEMEAADQAQAAIDGLNGSDLDGRSINVNEARPRPERGAGGGGGGGGRGRGGFRDRGNRW